MQNVLLQFAGILYMVVVYSFFGILGSYATKNIETLFGNDINTKSDLRIASEMISTFVFMVTFLYYLHNLVYTIGIPFDTNGLDINIVMSKCESMTVMFFVYTSHLGVKVDKFFELKLYQKVVKNIKDSI